MADRARNVEARVADDSFILAHWHDVMDVSFPRLLQAVVGEQQFVNRVASNVLYRRQ